MWSGMTGLFLKMEQINLYNEINFNLSRPSPDNATAIRRTIERVRLPVQSPGDLGPSGTGSNSTSQLGPSDYRGNQAAGFIPTTNSNCPSLTPVGTSDSNPFCVVYDNGMMYQNSQVNMADITDGTSTTILMGESIYPYGVWSQATTAVVRTNHRPDHQPADSQRRDELLDILGEQASRPGEFRLLRRDRSARDQPDQQDRPEQDDDPQRRRDSLERRDQVNSLVTGQ